MSRVRFARLLLPGLLLLLLARPAAAEIEVRGSDEFKQAVQECLTRYLQAGEEIAVIIQDLQSSQHKHIIVQTRARTSQAAPDDDRAAVAPAAGGTGAGCGSTVRWNPTNTSRFEDNVHRDPCASLYHELYHAWDFNRGRLDLRPERESRIKRSEVDATRAENRYRRSQDLPQRTQYGRRFLPENAMF